MTIKQTIIENKFEDLKVYINEKLINQDAKLKEICSSLLEELKTEIMKEVKIHKAKIKKVESGKVILQNQIEELRKLSTKNQNENEELEQLDR